jgi:hypothetical protein
VQASLPDGGREHRDGRRGQQRGLPPGGRLRIQQLSFSFYLLLETKNFFELSPGKCSTPKKIFQEEKYFYVKILFLPVAVLRPLKHAFHLEIKGKRCYINRKFQTIIQ